MNLEAHKILKYLLKEILVGTYKIGDILPKETELADKFKVNRMSPGLALKCLEENRLVVRKKRQGTSLLRIPSALESRRLLKPFSRQIDILANTMTNPQIHWNSITLNNLEQKINSFGYYVAYHDFSKLKTRKDIQKYMSQHISIDSYALVVMPVHGIECRLVLDNYDLFVQTHDNIYLLDNGTEPVLNWPGHRISQNPFLEGMCLSEYLIRASEENIIYYHPEQELHQYYTDERKRGFIVGMGRVSDTSVNLEFSSRIDPEYIQSRNVVIVTPHTTIATSLIKQLALSGMKAGSDFKIISMDNHSDTQQNNITSVAPPLDKYGTYLGELICEESFEKSRGNRISIEIYPQVIERKTYISKRI